VLTQFFATIHDYAWRIPWIGAVLTVLEVLLPQSRHPIITRLRGLLFWSVYIVITASALTIFTALWARLGVRPWIVLHFGDWFNRPHFRAIGTFAAPIAMQSLYEHSCMRLGLGPLRYIISDNRYHRIQHSIEPEHRNKNFGSFTPVWDLVFGTTYFPNKGQWPQTGVAGEDEPRTLSDFLFRPFLRLTGRQASASYLSRPLQHQPEVARADAGCAGGAPLPHVSGTYLAASSRRCRSPRRASLGARATLRVWMKPASLITLPRPSDTSRKPRPVLLGRNRLSTSYLGADMKSIAPSRCFMPWRSACTPSSSITR
jgi:hypothetical protein